MPDHTERKTPPVTIDVLWLPGTGFSTGPDLISTTFGAALDASRFEFRSLQYPAAYGGTGMSYAESKHIGRQILIDAITATPNRAVIGGYSQGAGIAGDLAASIGRGEHPDLDVLGCALIADPSRPLAATMPTRQATPGYGITGQRIIPGIPVWWAANPGDPITALPPGNPLRLIADISEYYSLSGPAAAEKWMVALWDHALTARWQRWWSLDNWRSWGGAAAYARGYLVDHRHTDDYITSGLAVDLAEIVNREVSA